jgi:hypothetical protein
MSVLLDERRSLRGDVRCLLEQITDPAKYPPGIYAARGAWTRDRPHH